jgi:hypothetical protein
VSSPLRPVRADTPGTPATPESLSILYASTAECTQKRHLTESSIFEDFHEFLRRAEKSKDYHYYASRINPATGAHEYFRKNGTWGDRCEYFYPYESLYNSLMRFAECESALERPRQ